MLRTPEMNRRCAGSMKLPPDAGIIADGCTAKGVVPLLHYRDLAPDERGAARRLFESMDLDSQLHHFQREMTAADFDLWEERAGRHHMIGCFDGDELVGIAEIAHGEFHAESSLWVEPGHRRRGIGTALFDRACAAARDRGARQLIVLVTRGDAEMLDMAIRHHGLSVFRHGSSMILPEGDQAVARWLAFDLASMPAGDWFSHAVRSVREAMGF